MKPWPPIERRSRSVLRQRSGRLRCAAGRVLGLSPLLVAACATSPRRGAPAPQEGPPALQQEDALPRDAPAASLTTAALDPTSGRLVTRYRARFKGHEDDHDLTQTLDLALADPDRQWAGALLARATWDLDGTEPDSDFFGLADTYDHRLEGQLFHAYVDLARPGLSLLRLGRQSLYETPLTLVFDGLRAELAPRGERRATLGAFAGVGEHPYESSADGDLVLGGFATLALWSGAELRADWMHLADERLGSAHEDDLFGLVLGTDLRGSGSAERTRLETRFTSLEGDGRDLRLAADHLDASRGFSVQASYYELLQTQQDLAAPLDPFTSTLFELFPYAQATLSATKDWEDFALLAGADLRRVDDADDEGAYNRDFERYWLTGSLPGLFTLDVALTGEVWRADGSDYETWGATLARPLDGGFELALGSYFALYEYDLSSADERDRVRTTYLDVQWRHGPARRWRLRCEFEHDEFDDYQEVRLDHAWSF